MGNVYLLRKMEITVNNFAVFRGFYEKPQKFDAIFEFGDKTVKVFLKSTFFGCRKKVLKTVKVAQKRIFDMCVRTLVSIVK